MKKTIGFSQMSIHNRLILLNLIREHKEISRADLVHLTPLTGPSVSRIISELKEQDLIIEKGIGQSTGGRKPVLFEFNPKSRCAVSIAIVRERIEMALLDFTPEVITHKTLYYPGKIESEETVEFIIKSINDFIKSVKKYTKKLAGICISVPGLIDTQKGSVRYSSPLGWRNIDLKSKIKSPAHIPVYIDNTIIAATLAEKLFGKKENKRNFLYLYAGIGIGAGMVINNKPYRGAQYSSMEIGHMTIEQDGVECACGKTGCWEELADISALVKRYIKASGDDVQDSFKKANQEEQLEFIVREYNEGNKAAHECIEESIVYLAVGMANLINIFNPETIYLSGWPTSFPESVLEEIKEDVEKRCMEGLAESLEMTGSSFDHNSELLVGGNAVVLEHFLFAEMKGE